MNLGKIWSFFVPRTVLGKWSVSLIAAFFLLFLASQLIIASGQQGGETFFSNSLISIPMLSAGLCAIASFLAGIISVIKNKERTILVYLATLIGFLVLVFVIGEIAVPH